MLASGRAVDLLPTILSLPAVRAISTNLVLICCSLFSIFPLSLGATYVRGELHFPHPFSRISQASSLGFKSPFSIAAVLCRVSYKIQGSVVVNDWPMHVKIFNKYCFDRTQARFEGAYKLQRHKRLQPRPKVNPYCI